MTDNQDSSQTDEDQNAGGENQQVKLKAAKKHKCQFCDKHFIHQNSVSRHISAVHERKKAICM